MLTTPNLGLKKPEANDTVNIADLNYNADVLDEQVTKRIINSGGVPELLANTLANRPAPGKAGRLFLATDKGEIYHDTGTAWELAAASRDGLAAHLADNVAHNLRARDAIAWLGGMF